MGQIQHWRQLSFLHWAVPSVKIPPWLELDTFDGQAWLGLVPFTMPQVNVSGIPIGGFHETNVRTYVRHNGRPGVYFLSLDAASLLAVTGARLFWGLPYHWARMGCHQDGARTRYQSARVLHSDRTLNLEIEQMAAPAPARLGTLEHFLVERYFLFTDRKTCGEVVHTPYAIAPARVHALTETLTGMTRQPDHVCVSPGVEVVVRGSTRVSVGQRAAESA